MKRTLLAAGALALAAFLPASGKVLAQAVTQQGSIPLPPPQAQGGNKALMADWVRKKQELRSQVVEDLRRKGLLPQNGSVTYEARVSQDPKNPGKILVRLESLSIAEKPGGKQQEPMAGPVFAPRGSSVQRQDVDVPVPHPGSVVRDTIPITGGKPRVPPAP